MEGASSQRDCLTSAPIPAASNTLQSLKNHFGIFLPPDAPDLIQRKLFTGQMLCFFDDECTGPPTSVEAYLAAEHIGVQFALGGASSEVLKSEDMPNVPAPRVTVSNFSGIPPFVKGTGLIATQIEFLRHTSLRDLAHAPLPFQSEPVSMFMVWHQRSTNDPAHKWLRGRTLEIAASWSKIDWRQKSS